MVKFLLCGNDSEMLAAFFSKGIKNVKFLSTTENPADLKAHVEGLQPDGFIYCAKNQNELQIENLKKSYDFLNNAQKQFFVISSEAELDSLYSIFGTKIKETISKDLGTEEILKKINTVVEEITKEKYGSLDPNVIRESKSKFANFMDNNNLAPSMLEKLGAAAAHAVGASDISKEVEKKRIMIVDDDPNVLRTIRNYLQDQYIISVASSGRVALKFLEDKTVDLILLDYMMPEMDGPLVLNYIRQSPKTRDIPVVFLTGVSEKNKIQQILELSIQGYLLKPVDTLKLLECVHNALQEN